MTLDGETNFIDLLVEYQKCEAPALLANIRNGRKQGTLTEGEGSVQLTSSLR